VKQIWTHVYLEEVCSPIVVQVYITDLLQLSVTWQNGEEILRDASSSGSPLSNLTLKHTWSRNERLQVSWIRYI
jgi:hypothetical protein